VIEEDFFLFSSKRKKEKKKNFPAGGLTKSAGWKRHLVNHMAG